MQRKMSCPGDLRGGTSYPLCWRTNCWPPVDRQSHLKASLQERDEEDFQLRAFFFFPVWVSSLHKTFYDSHGNTDSP